MCNTTHVDRETASKINPLIDNCWTEGTLDAVASVVYEVGFMVAETELSKGRTFHVFEVCSAALQWERENIQSCRMARLAKEQNHV